LLELVEWGGVILRSSKLVSREFIMICIPSLWVRIILLSSFIKILRIRIPKNRALVRLFLFFPHLIIALLSKLIIGKWSILVLGIGSISISFNFSLLFVPLIVGLWGRSFSICGKIRCVLGLSKILRFLRFLFTSSFLLLVGLNILEFYVFLV
jgi:hypothetical protein